jgi:hypothetical protein
VAQELKFIVQPIDDGVTRRQAWVETTVCQYHIDSPQERRLLHVRFVCIPVVHRFLASRIMGSELHPGLVSALQDRW